jgi:putative hydrolase of the HAD superfamily
VAALLSELTQRHRLAVVTNTHQADLVPTHLTAMGVASAIEVVITSVEIGWRKPHPAIYAAALDALGVVAADCTFVGDTRRPDYDGPRAAGIHALLIDPDGVEDIPAEHRLASILDLRDRFPVS